MSNINNNGKNSTEEQDFTEILLMQLYSLDITAAQEVLAKLEHSEEQNNSSYTETKNNQSRGGRQV